MTKKQSTECVGEPKRKWQGQIDNDEFFESIEQEQDDWGWGPHESHSQPKQEDYLIKAYRLANELRCHLAIAPAPQQRTWERPWVSLTDDEIEMIVENKRAAHWEFIRQVEAVLKEKNT